MKQPLVCTSCGAVGKPKKYMRGSSAIEIFLWVFLLFPGIVYSVWRLSTQYKGCPRCGKKTLIATDTAVGKKLLENYHANQTKS